MSNTIEVQYLNTKKLWEPLYVRPAQIMLVEEIKLHPNGAAAQITLRDENALIVMQSAQDIVAQMFGIKRVWVDALAKDSTGLISYRCAIVLDAISFIAPAEQGQMTIVMPGGLPVTTKGDHQNLLNILGFTTNENASVVDYIL